MAVSYAVGIDLGTTFCCVAVLRQSNQRPEIIPNEVGKNTTPSFVAYDEEGNVCAGETAKDLAMENPESTVFDVKRLIGRSFHDPFIQKYMKLWPFQVVNIDGLVGVKVDEQRILPQTVAQELLSHLRNFSQTFLHCTIESAVVTIPAYFNDIQKGLTRDACYRAGLKKVEFVTEPQAAAYAYGLQSSLPQGKSKFCLVFDLGGGTFDVTIFKIFSNKKVKIMATGGDASLRGEDFNDLLMEYCIKDFQNNHNIDLTAGKNSEDAETCLRTAKALRRLRNDCEKKKIHLSTTKKVVVSVHALYNGIDFALTITRTDFEKLIDSHLKKCLATIDKVLQKSKVRKNKIEDVVLIGGSSRIPKVEQVVSKYFGGIQVHRDINADEAVAYGAAVHAYNVFQALPSEATVTIQNINEHIALYTSIENNFPTSQSNLSTAVESAITVTPNADSENNVTNVYWIWNLIMRLKFYLLLLFVILVYMSTPDLFATWFEELKNLEGYMRHTPKNEIFNMYTLNETISYTPKYDPSSSSSENEDNESPAAVTIESLNVNEHMEVNTSDENNSPTSQPDQSTSAGDEIQPTPNLNVEKDFTNLYYIRDIIMKYKSYFLSKTDELVMWFENLQKIEDGFRNNPKASEYAFELRLSALLDTSTLQDLAFILFENREDKGAGELYQSIYDRLKATVGEDHVNAIKVEVQIARCFCRHYFVFREKLANYVQIFKSANKRMSKALGKSHPDTLQVQYFLAWSLWLNSKDAEALELAENVYKSQASALGTESDEALRTRVLISICLCFLERYDDARETATVLFQKQHQFLDSKDSETLFIKIRLSSVLNDVGKYKEALSLAEDVYETQQKNLTSGHIVMLDTQRIIGLCYIDLKKYERGLAQLELVFEGRKKILGKDHELTLRSQHDIAWATDWSGRKLEALKLFRVVYEKQLKSLGPNHKDTLITKGNIDTIVNA